MHQGRPPLNQRFIMELKNTFIRTQVVYVWCAVALLLFRRLLAAQISSQAPNNLVFVNSSVALNRPASCQPMSDSSLQAQLGSAFLAQHMAFDEPAMKQRKKRSLLWNLQDQYTTDEPSEEPIKTNEEVDQRLSDIHGGSAFGFGRVFRSLSRRKRSDSPQRKRKIRHRNTNNAWTCQFEPYWETMGLGVYPRFIKTGKCVNKKCMYAAYRCKPKKYNIKVLKRDPTSCRPVPTIGSNTTYEEVWEWADVEVIVACECKKGRKLGRRRRKYSRISKDVKG